MYVIDVAIHKLHVGPILLEYKDSHPLYVQIQDVYVDGCFFITHAYERRL